MAATHYAPFQLERGSGEPASENQVAPESAGSLCPSAFLAALIAGGLAWFGLLRLAAWVV